MSKKKKYNPFKMWGSWVGILIVFIWMFFFSGNAYIFKEAPPHLSGWNFNCPSFGPAGGNDNGCSFFNWFFGIIPLVLYVISFLLGWGIHSLVRKLK